MIFLLVLKPKTSEKIFFLSVLKPKILEKSFFQDFKV